MKILNLFGVMINLSLCVYSCDPPTESNQSVYCRARYVLTGVARSVRLTSEEAVFRIKVTSNIKGEIARPGSKVTLYGSGTSEPCGPTILKKNQKYLIYDSDRSLVEPCNRSPASPRDTCVIRDREFDCNFDEGFCARRPSYPYGPRVCQWIAPQTPCAPRG